MLLRLPARLLDLSTPGWRFVVSIIAFHSKIHANLDLGYYSTAFHGYQQKEISGFLTCMWQSDPFKAKWSILAKAYSLIRDSQGKDDAPLDQFLAITGPLIGIIMPGHYLQTMGWNITTNKDGQTIMRRDDRFLNERLFLTNLSVNDLIRHCFNQGFFFGELFEVLSSDNEVVMTMASSVQSTATSQTSMLNHLQVTDGDFANGVEAEGFSTEGRTMNKDDIAAQPTGEVNPEHNTIEGTGGFMNLSEAHDLSNASTVAEGGTALTIPALSYDGSPGGDSPSASHENLSSGALGAVVEGEETGHSRIISDDLNPASGLSAANFQLTSHYPFNAEFDPNSSAFVFDPFLGNQFDVFEMSDISWNELVDFDSCP